MFVNLVQVYDTLLWFSYFSYRNVKSVAESGNFTLVNAPQAKPLP